MTYSVLALDQSMTSTGWAHYRQDDKMPTWGLHTLPPWGDEEGRYLWEWFEWLGEKARGLAVTHIFLEDTRFHHKHEETLTQMLASIGLIGQACIVAHLLTKRGQPVELLSVQPQQWRKEFLGAMNRPEAMSKTIWRKMLKEAAVAQCLKRGWLVEKDDEADALGILTYGICTIDTTFRFRQGALFRQAESDHDKSVAEFNSAPSPRPGGRR